MTRGAVELQQTVAGCVEVLLLICDKTNVEAMDRNGGATQRPFMRLIQGFRAFFYLRS